LRKAAEQTLAALWDTNGILIPTFTPADCAKFFAAAGVKSRQAAAAPAR
jgi:hypothetical protein